ncbi:CDP-glucose 4,6-dehydratase [Lutimonas saemankumensis]|uniref:CDP-glucose 4,6-dehydratase n=1 Tax=Lutimonas saemankumensis TaxID=483016 RepID=UPI001CD6F7D9|nr:CDP-glucose 4,6-dehydratase [Lutimonas saemankumensis]MCA0931057.1 CDP-glucose 4,6-dehydratase [Lutimonas saemankumensis]
MGLKELKKYYQGKKVLVTGHTGFKGSWLVIWLLDLGADVIGFSLEELSEKDNYRLSGISHRIKDLRGDIRDLSKIKEVFEAEKPEIVFHLAAQSLVIEGYNNPIYTYETNVMGTVNMLEAIRLCESIQTAIFVTTDKVYENNEWIWPYRENEPMGGYDPYSSSKGASELVIASYRHSFFNPSDYEDHGKSIASVRAGNVIGGGDWNKNRIVPDCINAIENDEMIKVRNPNAVRPWQHVLEPLGGYLILGMEMMKDPEKYSEAWNFGPEVANMIKVSTLVDEIVNQYGKGNWKDESIRNAPHEANFLSLDINKVKYRLNWNPLLSFEETISYTVDWYKNYKTTNVFSLCQSQIKEYTNRLG